MCEVVMWQEVDLVGLLQREKAIVLGDAILNEIIVYGECKLIESLTQLMNTSLEEECVPADWKKITVKPLLTDTPEKRIPMI